MKARLRLNPVISVIITTDFLLTAAASILSPIFALFVVGEIPGGSARVVGIALAIYWVVKSSLQLPIAKYLDKNHGEIDDYYSLLFGAFLGAMVMGGYFFAREVWHVYALQVVSGIADSFLVPPFYAIFTRHLDENREGFEWSIRSSLSYGVGAAIGGTLGGFLLAIIGFRYIFVLAASVYITGALVLMFLKPFVRPKVPHKVKRVFVEQKRL
jgi:MFS family permease